MTDQADGDSVWSILGKGKRQVIGPITAPNRNSHRQVLSGHDNRAGHRLYVKVNQPRAFRKSVVGFGRGAWRRLHTGYETHAFDSGSETGTDRRYLRQDTILAEKHFRRLNRKSVKL